MARRKKVLKDIENFTEKLVQARLEEVVGERFGVYSKYVIQERALPNVKDGLKPVQRRILYGMYKMGLWHNKPFKKSARIVGDVMGKYHPHGDSSIYEAMVRLSQDFKTNMMLVEMHGNNGSIDGDPAAAMRYTEARLTSISEELLKDINKNTVDFIPNFDDEEYEPVVLPSKYPNILVNGSTGISSGYATNIPPHNLNEVIKATIHRIDDPAGDINSIMEFISGPDFPTGGIIQGVDGIKQAYETGKGRIIIRSKTEIKKRQIVITEIPYEVNKANLVRKIDEIRIGKKLTDIQEVRDESDREGLRVVIECKKDSDPEFVLNYLFKHTELQTSYNFNMVAIANKRPEQMGLLRILDEYILHQKDVITNRSNYELEKAETRLHIVDGLIKMVDIIDEVIKIIRASQNKASAKDGLIEAYGFSEVQVEAIVTLQLYKLSSTDLSALQNEAKDLKQTIKRLNMILSSEEMLKVVIKAELEAIALNNQEERKSALEAEIEEIKITEEDLIKDNDVIVSVTAHGYVKQTSMRSYQASEENQIGLKEDDGVIGIYNTKSRSTLLMFTSKGNYLYIPVYKLPDIKWKELGTHVSNMVLIDSDENIVYSEVIDEFSSGIDVLIATKNGYIKRVQLDSFLAQRFSKKLKAIKLGKEDVVVSVDIGTANEVAIFTKEGAINKYNADEISLIGIQSAGVSSINLKNRPNDHVVKAKFIEENNDAFMLTTRGNIIRINLDNIEKLSRTRKPIQVTSYIKSNPHDIKDVLIVTKREYLDSEPITILNTTEKVTIPAFDVKYAKSDNGKKYTPQTMHSVSQIIKVCREKTYTPLTREIKEKAIKKKVEVETDSMQISFDLNGDNE